MSDLEFIGDMDVEKLADAAMSFDTIPRGWYYGYVNKIEVVDTNDKTGKRITFRLTIEGPEHANQNVFDAFNVANKSEKAQKIGLEQFASFLEGCGVSARPKSVSELMGKKLSFLVAIEKGNDEYPNDKNVVKGFKTYDPKGGSTSSLDGDEEVPF